MKEWFWNVRYGVGIAVLTVCMAAVFHFSGSSIWWALCVPIGFCIGFCISFVIGKGRR